MTDQDELRDRIEEVIWKRTTLPTETTMFVAQAVIDEFGLTVETVNRKPNGGLCSKHCLDEEHAKNSVTRVVGKWEEAEEQEPRP